jgi:hypothetical protein
MTNRSEDEPAEFSSPACSMPEADDAYGLRRESGAGHLPQ